jgi:hypothetical protein
MIRKPSRHRRRSSQASVDATEIVKSKMQSNAYFRFSIFFEKPKDSRVSRLQKVPVGYSLNDKPILL